jgi:hypothetical protein
MLHHYGTWWTIVEEEIGNLVEEENGNLVEEEIFSSSSKGWTNYLF